MANAHKGFFDNKTILITGGTGSWGNELVKQLFENHNPHEIRIYSRGEHKQVEMKRRYTGEQRLKYTIGDVRDKAHLTTAMRGVDYVFHLAALKHVPVCEENPWESVQTNIVGAQNVIEAAIENNVKKVIDVSTDKAVDPFNLYGTCKAVGEKLMVAANLIDTPTRFVVIRGGNVLGTNGSVVPLFRDQILYKGTVTITEPSMTRYMISLEQAIGLIFEATVTSVGGEIFVMKMPALTVDDLANVMIEELSKYRNAAAALIDVDGNNIKVSEERTVSKNSVKKNVIGIRPGEKLHEVLVSRYEARSTIESGSYYIILPTIAIPSIHERYQQKPRVNIVEFTSENAHQLSLTEIRDMLAGEGWLSPAHASSARETDRQDMQFYFEQKKS